MTHILILSCLERPRTPTNAHATDAAVPSPAKEYYVTGDNENGFNIRVGLELSAERVLFYQPGVCVFGRLFFLRIRVIALILLSD